MLTCQSLAHGNVPRQTFRELVDSLAHGRLKLHGTMAAYSQGLQYSLARMFISTVCLPTIRRVKKTSFQKRLMALLCLKLRRELAIARLGSRVPDVRMNAYTSALLVLNTFDHTLRRSGECMEQSKLASVLRMSHRVKRMGSAQQQ